MLTPPIPLDADARLGVQLTASTTTVVAIRALVSNTIDGPVRNRDLGTVVHSAGDRTIESTFFSLAGGFLWGAVATVGAGKRGELYVMLTVTPGRSNRDYRLAAGYVHSGPGGSLGDGEFAESGPGGGQGNLRSIDLGDPAAGADYADITVPANALWKIRGFHGVFTTAAGGTDRSPSIRIQDGANVVVGGTRANVIQDPSEVATYLGANNNYGHQYDQSVTGSVYNFVMPDFLIPEGFDVTFITQFIDGSDNWGDGQLLVEEWLTV